MYVNLAIWKMDRPADRVGIPVNVKWTVSLGDTEYAAVVVAIYSNAFLGGFGGCFEDF